MCAFALCVIWMMSAVFQLNYNGSEASENYMCPSTCKCTQLQYPVMDGWSVECALHRVCNKTDLTLLDGNQTKHLKLTCVKYSECEHLTENQFNHLTNLEQLQVSNCPITSSGTGLFKGRVTDIKVLQITGLDIARSMVNKPSALTGLPYLEQINLTNSEIEHLSPYLFSNLSHLTDINVSFNKLKSMHIDQFLGVFNLKNLFMQNNNLTHLPVSLFRDISQLITLNLYGNRLGNDAMDPQLLGHLTKLEALNLGRNGISHLQECQLFKQMNHLKHLDLSFNFIQNIPRHCFIALRNLMELRLGHNHLQDIPEALSRLSSLSFLYIEDNQISLWNKTRFSNVKYLTILNMTGNELTYMPNRAFINTPNLQIIYLANNRINLMEDDTFYNITFLSILDLSHNCIVHIPRGILHLMNLKYLLLHHNQISYIANNLLPVFLEGLDISYNNISFLENMPFYRLTHCILVNISHNPSLRRLSKKSVLIASPSHRTPALDLSNNRLSCDCTMSWIGSLKRHSDDNHMRLVGINQIFCSNVANQRLVELPSFKFKCFLSTLQYSAKPECTNCTDCPNYCTVDCPSECVCYRNDHTFNPKILKVQCDNRNTSQIPKNIPTFALQYSFVNNGLTRLKYGLFINFNHPLEVNLHHNMIYSIGPHAFYGFQHLQLLDLSNNNLTTLRELTFQHIERSLTDLNLSNNQLTKLSTNVFSELTFLTKLYLNGNYLSFVNPALSIGPSITMLTLSNNPWLCDCSHGPSIHQFILSYEQVIGDLNDIICDPSKEWPKRILTNATNSYVTRDFSDLSDDTIGTTSQTTPLWKANFIHCHDYTVGEYKQDPGLEQSHTYAVALASAIVILFILLGLCLVIFHSQLRIKLCIFKYLGYLTFHGDKYSESKDYDAFISYSNEDENVVVHKLVPRLEAMSENYKLCLHYRDWPVGASIAETIINSVQRSRRTILLVSRNFVKSEWCQYEFQAAHHQVFECKKVHLIIIMLEDIPLRQLNPSLRLYIKTNTYLRWNDEQFWDKLHYAMPTNGVRQETD